MLTAVLFIAFTLICYILSLTKGPFWGLIGYANLYFNNPDVKVNWWGEYFPGVRWSLLSFGVLIASTIIHRDKLSNHKFGFTFYLVVMMSIIVEVVTYAIAIAPSEAKWFAYWMLGYCIMTFLMIKVLNKFEQLRLYLLIIIVMGALLGIEAYMWGKLLDGRINNIGPADAHGSNELGILLGSIIPFQLPFIVAGKKYEKNICFLSLPFIINGFTLTVSRSAFVSLILSVICTFVFVADRRIKKYISVGLICLMPVFFYFIDNSYINRISSLWQTDINSFEAVNQLSSDRIYIWKYGFNMANDYPFGVGPDGFKQLARLYMPSDILSFHKDQEYGVKAAHNTFLLLLVELGYLGVICYLFICFAVLSGLWKSSRILKQIGQGTSFLYFTIIALHISFLCTLFGGLTGETFYYEFFWYQVAIVIVLKSFVTDMQQSYLKKQNGFQDAVVAAGV